MRWGAAGLTACGRCDYCQEMVKATDDLLLVARMNSAQRKNLHADGIRTVTELAEATLVNPAAPLLRLQQQARMQSGTGGADGGVRYVKDGEEHSLRYAVIPENTLAELPPPSRGDIFFDFEGDPLWQESATGVWGLEYLFGVIEAPIAPGARGCSGRSGRTAGRRRSRRSWISWPMWRSAGRTTRTCTSTTTPRTRKRPSASSP